MMIFTQPNLIRCSLCGNMALSNTGTCPTCFDKTIDYIFKKVSKGLKNIYQSINKEKVKEKED